MKDNQYVVIQAFMVNDLKLKGNELIVYATIYGFTQDGGHWFYGTRGYLAEWCGAKRETVDRCLKSLIEKGYIERRDVEEHGRTFVQYRATMNAHGTQKTGTPPKKTGTPTPKNGHINKIEEQPKTQGKKERKSRSTFDAIIAERTDNPELVEVIGEFIRMRSRIGKPLTDYALTLRLNKLWRLGSTDEERIAIAQQSIGACWQDFFELKRDGAPRSSPSQRQLSDTFEQYNFGNRGQVQQRLEISDEPQQHYDGDEFGDVSF